MRWARSGWRCGSRSPERRAWARPPDRRSGSTSRPTSRPRSGERRARLAEAAADAGRLSTLRRRLPLGLALGAAVALAVGIAGDAPKVASALFAFQWGLLPLILALTLVNYLVRFVKWTMYLRLIGAPPISAGESFLLFFSGLAMTITPGKVGEWLKSYLLR